MKLVKKGQKRKKVKKPKFYSYERWKGLGRILSLRKSKGKKKASFLIGEKLRRRRKRNKLLCFRCLGRGFLLLIGG